MDEKNKLPPLEEVVKRIFESGVQEADLWSLEPYFEKESQALVPIFLAWLRERPHNELLLELLCKHAIYNPELGPSILEAMKMRVEQGEAPHKLARVLEYAIYKLGAANPWQREITDFALALAGTSAQACDYLRYPAWSMLAREQAVEWAPGFFREIVNRIDDEGNLLATLEDMMTKTYKPFESLWPHVVYISRRIDGAPYGPSLLFAAMNSDSFMEGLCAWINSHSPGTLSNPLEDFRLAMLDKQHLNLLASTLSGDAARYFRIFGDLDDQRAAAIASFMVWRKVRWPDGGLLHLVDSL